MSVPLRSEGVKSQSDNVRVIARVAPLSGYERETEQAGILQTPADTDGLKPNQVVITHPVHSHSTGILFDHLCVPNSSISTTEQLYDIFFPDLLKDLQDGFNVCVLAYGQSGSGKTHTMLGTKSEPGLMIQAGAHLFDLSSKMSPECKSEFEVNYIEIYNEKVYDLLDNYGKHNNDNHHHNNKNSNTNHNKSNNNHQDKINTNNNNNNNNTTTTTTTTTNTNLSPAPRSPSPKSPAGFRVREHKIFGPFVEGVHSVVVDDVEELRNVILQGQISRHVCCTEVAQNSSRGHTLFTVTWRQRNSDDKKKSTMSKLVMGDLAGTGQGDGIVGKNKAAKLKPASKIRKQEGAAINKSLSTLGMVITQLSSKRSSTGGGMVTAYRDSTLTFLLKDALGGNAKTALIATLSQGADSYEETLATMRFTEKSRKIVNKIKRIFAEDPASPKKAIIPDDVGVTTCTTEPVYTDIDVHDVVPPCDVAPKRVPPVQKEAPSEVFNAENNEDDRDHTDSLIMGVQIEDNDEKDSSNTTNTNTNTNTNTTIDTNINSNTDATTNDNTDTNTDANTDDTTNDNTTTDDDTTNTTTTTNDNNNTIADDDTNTDATITTNDNTTITADDDDTNTNATTIATTNDNTSTNDTTTITDDNINADNSTNINDATTTTSDDNSNTDATPITNDNSNTNCTNTTTITNDINTTNENSDFDENQTNDINDNETNHNNHNNHTDNNSYDNNGHYVNNNDNINNTDDDNVNGASTNDIVATLSDDSYITVIPTGSQVLTQTQPQTLTQPQTQTQSQLQPQPQPQTQPQPQKLPKTPPQTPPQPQTQPPQPQPQKQPQKQPRPPPPPVPTTTPHHSEANDLFEDTLDLTQFVVVPNVEPNLEPDADTDTDAFLDVSLTSRVESRADSERDLDVESEASEIYPLMSPNSQPGSRRTLLFKGCKAEITTRDLVPDEKRKNKFHVMYGIKISSKFQPEMYHSWEVKRRYSEFLDLHKNLKKTTQSGMVLRLPPKRFVKDNMDEIFLRKRQAHLNLYLEALLGIETLVRSQYTLKFLDV